MSFVIAAPEMMTSAATDLATIGSDLSAAHLAAAAPTVALVPAAADEVSAGVAHLFSRYAEGFHGLAGRAAVFHEQVVGHLSAGAASYANAEAANAALLQPLNANAVSPAATFPPQGGWLAGLFNFFTHANSLLISILGVQGTSLLEEALIGVLIILTAPISIPILIYIVLGLSLL